MFLLVTGLLCGCVHDILDYAVFHGYAGGCQSSVVEKVLAAEFQFIHTAGHGQLLDELLLRPNQLRG